MLSAVAASFYLCDRRLLDGVLNEAEKWASKGEREALEFSSELGVAVIDRPDYVEHPLPTGIARLRKRGRASKTKTICFETLDE